MTITLIPKLGGEFMPQLEEGNLWIRAVMPRTTSLEQAAQIAPQLRDVIASVPEVKGVMSQIGRPDDGTDVTGFFNIEFNVPLKPMEQWRKDKLGPADQPRGRSRRSSPRSFKEFPGLNFNFSQFIRDNVEEALSGVKGANSVKLFGSDLEHPRGVRPAGAQDPQDGPGDRERRPLPHRRSAQPGDQDRSRGVCPLRRERAGRRVSRSGGHRRPAFSQMVEGEKLFDIVLRLPYDCATTPR